MEENQRWLDWAIELQALAQAGLYYGQDRFDLERYERIREIAGEMMARQADLPLAKVKELFLNETGYQTPKLDTRAAVFQNDRILLVKENNGLWSLPGGWVDVNLSIKENTEKEALEEAGLRVRAERIIAVQDRKKHNQPPHAFSIIKVFVLCACLGGSFQPNSETTESGFFSLEKLPELCNDKNTLEQVKICFQANDDPDWRVLFD